MTPFFKWRQLAAAMLTLCSLSPLHTLAQNKAMPSTPLATLGDSDTHGYHDTVAFPDGGPQRGGQFAKTTHQWTEILATLRPGQIDLGPLGTRGTQMRLARALEFVGFEPRSPVKFDHLHNFAYSGLGCESLMNGHRQVPRLLQLMKTNPAAWQRGAVIIRIGMNNFAQKDVLDIVAERPNEPDINARVDACLHAYTQATQAIRAQHPQVAIVLVGIFNNANLSYRQDRWHDPKPLAHIDSVLNRFDNGLKRLVASDQKIAFFDDRAWFASLWGGRDASGKPAYRRLVLGPNLEVSNTIGDAPQNAFIADGHSGTAYNAKWAQAMVNFLNTSFAMGIRPITDEEVMRLVAPLGVWPSP
jgi:hypothetical protein